MKTEFNTDVVLGRKTERFRLEPILSLSDVYPVPEADEDDELPIEVKADAAQPTRKSLKPLAMTKSKGLEPLSIKTDAAPRAGLKPFAMTKKP